MKQPKNNVTVTAGDGMRQPEIGDLVLVEHELAGERNAIVFCGPQTKHAIDEGLKLCYLDTGTYDMVDDPELTVRLLLPGTKIELEVRE